MKLRPISSLLLVLIITLTLLASGESTSLEIQQAVLHDSPAVHFEILKRDTLDALRIHQDPSMVLSHCSDITISCCELHSIELIKCERVRIQNCWIHDSKRCGITAYHCRDLQVEGCRVENVATGLYAIDSSDIRFRGNFTRNVQGPFPRGQMVQFDNVTGRKCAIQYNYAINEVGKSHPEDVINLYQSRGEPGAPIMIENNYVTGDPIKGSEGKSKTGSGIMLGDKGGAWLLCRRNVVLSAGQVGIGVAGGTNIQVEENLISGDQSNVSNVGLYAWNQSDVPSSKVAIIGNRVRWMDSHGEANGWWRGEKVDELELRGNRFEDDQIEAAVPPPPSSPPNPPRISIYAQFNDQCYARVPWKN